MGISDQEENQVNTATYWLEKPDFFAMYMRKLVSKGVIASVHVHNKDLREGSIAVTAVGKIKGNIITLRSACLLPSPNSDQN